jgi:hypothetical protein
MSESDIRTEAKAEAERTAADEDAVKRADGLKVDPDVKKSYEEATERGANVKGEGAIP